MKEILKNTRTIRLYDESKPMTKEQMQEIVEALRYVPQAANAQKIQFVTSVDPQMNAKIFPLLHFAGQIPDYAKRQEGKAPTGYLVLVKKSGSGVMLQDAGILELAAGLMAHSLGLGYCILASVNRKELSKVLGLSEDYEIIDVISFGVPAQKAEIVDSADGATRYYEDESYHHFVMKLPREFRILKSFE